MSATNESNQKQLLDSQAAQKNDILAAITQMQTSNDQAMKQLETRLKNEALERENALKREIQQQAEKHAREVNAMREEHSRSIDDGVQRVKEHMTSQVESLPAIAAAHNETLARINTMEKAMLELQTTVAEPLRALTSGIEESQRILEGTGPRPLPLGIASADAENRSPRDMALLDVTADVRDQSRSRTRRPFSERILRFHR
jgi:hypothetical protein